VRLQLRSCFICDIERDLLATANLFDFIFSSQFVCMLLILFLDYNEQMSHTCAIRAHYVFLLETLELKLSGLVGQLYLLHVLSAEERDSVNANMSFRANEKLLSVLSRKSPQQFQLFLDALDNCVQQHVCSVIAGPQGSSTG